MLVALAVACSLAAAALAGGKLSRLADVRLRHGWWLFVALAVQVGVTSVVARSHPTLGAFAHIATYAVAAGVVVANRRLPGMVLIGVGAAANAVAITVNGGTLPASASALARAGLALHPSGFANSAALSHPRLSWLGDNYAVPPPVPFHNVFSLGDVLVVLGVTVLVVRVTTRSTARGPGEPATCQQQVPPKRDVLLTRR